MEYKAKYFEDGEFIGVEFEDLPGCFTQGNNLSEAKIKAKSAVDCYFGGSNSQHKKLYNAKTGKVIVIPADVEYYGAKLKAKIEAAI